MVPNTPLCPNCKSNKNVGINLTKEASKKAGYQNWFEIDSWYCYLCKLTFNERSE